MPSSGVKSAVLVMVESSEIVLAFFLAERRGTRFALVTEKFLGIFYPVLDELAFGELLCPGVLFVLYCSPKLVVVLQKLLPGILKS